MKRRIRHKMRKLRKDRGLTHKFMSEQLGFSFPSGYSNIEAGRNRLSYDQAVKIAEIFEVNVSELEDDPVFFEEKLHKKCKKQTA